MSTYFLIRLFSVPEPYQQAVSDLAFEMEALGVSESTGDLKTNKNEPECVDVYFQERPPESFFEKVRSLHSSIEVQVHHEQERDWLAEWKKHYKPFELTEGYWVVPTWLEAPKEAQKVIQIDPGMAFGTGTHETTQLASRLLLRSLCEKPQAKVFDIGSGTGILAFLAAMAGAGAVEATDIDPESIRVAQENLEINKSSLPIPVQFFLEPEHQGVRADIVVANIIDGILVDIQDRLWERLKPEGHLIVSGILLERRQNFLENFRLPSGWTWTHEVKKGDWLGFCAHPLSFED